MAPLPKPPRPHGFPSKQVKASATKSQSTTKGRLHGMAGSPPVKSSLGKVNA